MPKLLVINAPTVRELLPMADCIDAMDVAMRAVSAKRMNAPARTFLPLIDNSGVMTMMPASLSEPRAYGLKVLSLHRKNAEAGLPPSKA